MASRVNQEPHADTDPRRGPDPNRTDMPEGLRRERKAAYGPSGRHDEKIEPEEGAQKSQQTPKND